MLYFQTPYREQVYPRRWRDIEAAMARRRTCFRTAGEIDNNFGDRDHFRVRMNAKQDGTDIGGGEITFHPYRFNSRLGDSTTVDSPNGDIEIRIPVGHEVTTDGLSCFPSMMAYG